jgi:hypothetical protein
MLKLENTKGGHYWISLNEGRVLCVNTLFGADEVIA